MFGIGFVCLSVICGNYVGHLVCLFVCWLGDLCWALRLLFVGVIWALSLSVCWLGDLCLALHLSVICGNYVGHSVG